MGRHWLAAAGLGLLPAAAVAQIADGGASPPGATASDEIVVTGQAPAVQSSIDRKVYSTTRDLQSSTGSVSDVLRNVPSVDVDAQGNVSLRGDTNVQILIDGRPSTLVNGASRAEALQQLPANSIDRVEVMTNPSAQFRPDGSSGVINIITKKNRLPGYSGTVQASAGTDGRLSTGLTGGYNRGGLSLTGTFSLRRDHTKRPFADFRSQVDPSSGLFLPREQTSLTRAHVLSRIATLNADYDLTAKDRLSGTFTFNDRTQAPRIAETNTLRDGLGGLTAAYDRAGSGDEDERTLEGTARYRHAFDRKGEQFTLDLRRSETTEDRFRRYITTYLTPAQADLIQEQHPTRDEVQRELNAEYTLPLGKTKLVLGYDLIRDDADYDNNGGTIDNATGLYVADPSFTNRFVYGRSIHAFYGTFNGPVAGKLTANGGLRLEETIVDTNQVTSAQKDRTRYFRAYPTLQLQYDLSAASNLRASYSRRVVRPDPEDLNPYVLFSDPLNLRAGNARLLPEQTQSIELGYSYAKGSRSLEATLFYRRTTNAFTEVRIPLDANRVLTTRANLGRNSNAGLDLSARSKLGRILTVGVSGVASYNRIDASNLGFAGTRSGFNYTVKGNVDAQITRKDLLQLTANYAGRRLTAQGYRLANGYLNLGYRHQLTAKLSLVATLSDVLNSQRERSTIDLPTLKDLTVRRRTRRAASLALSWSFGGTSKPPSTKINYEN